MLLIRHIAYSLVTAAAVAAAPAVTRLRRATATGDTWAIRNMSRICSEGDELCEWTFVIDTGVPLPGDPAAQPTYTDSTTTTISRNSSVDADAEADTTVQEDDEDDEDDDEQEKQQLEAPTSSPYLTPCTHIIASMADGTPASRATSTSRTLCGGFGVSSGWTRVNSDGTSNSGHDAAPDAADGFTVLSVVDAAKGLLAYPAYSDEELVSAAAVDGGVVRDRRFVVEKI